MARKLQEWIYLEWFLKEESIVYQSIEEADPPDFFLTLNDKRIAVEITNLYYESKPSRKGSKRKQQESHRTQWLKELSDSYYCNNRTPILLKILFPESESYRDATSDILTTLSECNKLDVWENERYEVESKPGTIKLFAHRLSDEFHQYSRWSCINDHMGFVASITEDHIVNAVNKKKDRIKSYQPSCDEVWLLLVVDPSWKSGLLQYNGLKPSLEKSGFDSVWLLEYLDKAHQLLG